MKSSAGRASQAKARARSSSGVASGWRGAMISATRHTVASTATASPASRRAISILRPNSSVRPSRANRLRRSASDFSSCRAGSASMILASATARTRPADSVAIIRDVAESTRRTLSARRWRDSLAMRRATHTSHSPRRHTAQVSGSRCCKSSTSARALREPITPVPRARAISPRQKSCTRGVPSPPTWTSTLPSRRAAAASGPWVGSLEWTAAHWASTTSSSISACRRACTASDARARSPAASRSVRSSIMCSILRSPTDTRKACGHRVTTISSPPRPRAQPTSEPQCKTHRDQ